MRQTRHLRMVELARKAEERERTEESNPAPTLVWASFASRRQEPEWVYVGIDVGKEKHDAGFISRRILANSHGVFNCPTHTFANTREGFASVVAAISTHGDLRRCAVLVEHTGHYHLALVQYLQEQNIPVYVR